jgi:UDP-N-acetyl-D-mannosaminuronic acid dehydrogenase
LIRTARLVNDSKPDWVVDKVRQAAKGLPAPVVACLGLAYKADIDDLRESPAVEIVEKLAAIDGLTVLPVEPYVDVLPRSLAERGLQLSTAEEALARADIVLLLVNHQKFTTIEQSVLDGKITLDTRGVW